MLEWVQDDSGADRYLETRDLVYFPQQLTIPSGETRVIRVGYRNPSLGPEKTYRMYIEQRSDRGSADGAKAGERSAELNVTVRFGVPVFLRPDKPDQRAAVSALVASRGVAEAEVRNSGNVHFRIGAVQFTGVDVEGRQTFSQSLDGWYLLSGAARRYRTAIPPDACRRTARIRVEVLGDKLGLAEERTTGVDSCP